MDDFAALAPTPKRRSSAEETQQRLLFRWAEWAGLDAESEDARRLGALLHAYPIGGYRSITTARMVKATGGKSDLPDIFLPVARHGFHGFYIELKAISTRTGKPGRVRPGQRDMAERLRAEGYRVDFIVGWSAAADALCDYLALPDRLRPGGGWEGRATIERGVEGWQ